MQTIHIASDHAGYALKEHLVQFLAQKGINVVDDGTHSTESCDYPVLAHKLCAAVEKEQGTGILICGTGIGISIAANRHSGIRAALCATELQARLSRQHNNANVLCLGARIIGVSVLDRAENAENHLLTGPCILHEYRSRGLASLLLRSSLDTLRTAGLKHAYGIARDKTAAARFVLPFNLKAPCTKGIK